MFRFLCGAGPVVIHLRSSFFMLEVDDGRFIVRPLCTEKRL